MADEFVTPEMVVTGAKFYALSRVWAPWPKPVLHTATVVFWDTSWVTARLDEDRVEVPYRWSLVRQWTVAPPAAYRLWQLRSWKAGRVVGAQCLDCDHECPAATFGFDPGMCKAARSLFAWEMRYDPWWNA